jgi:dihydrofolate reductase
MIKIIVAISKNRVIGKDNKLIWKLSSDLRRFKELTSHNPVVMGRKTYESIGKALPGRRNIVISRNPHLEIEGCEVTNSLEEALLLCNNDCFIIGGGEIYRESLPIAQKIYLTSVDCQIEGDAFFPEIDSTWREIRREDFVSDEKNGFNFSFIDYERYQF